MSVEELATKMVKLTNEREDICNWILKHSADYNYAKQCCKIKYPEASNVVVHDNGHSWTIEITSHGEVFQFKPQKILNRGPDGNEGFISQEPIYMYDDVLGKFETRYFYLRNVRDELGISWQWVFDTFAKFKRREDRLKDISAELNTLRSRIQFINSIQKSE